jgi:hypothetical protein
VPSDPLLFRRLLPIICSGRSSTVWVGHVRRVFQSRWVWFGACGMTVGLPAASPDPLHCSAWERAERAPDLPCDGREMTKRMTGPSHGSPTEPWRPFRSGSEASSSTGEPNRRRCRLMVGQQLPTDNRMARQAVLEAGGPR